MQPRSAAAGPGAREASPPVGDLPERRLFARARAAIATKLADGAPVRFTVSLAMRGCGGQSVAVFDATLLLALSFGELLWWLADSEAEAAAKPLFEFPEGCADMRGPSRWLDWPMLYMCSSRGGTWQPGQALGELGVRAGGTLDLQYVCSSMNVPSC